MLRPRTTPLFLLAATLALCLPAADTLAAPDGAESEPADVPAALEAGAAMRAGALIVVPIRQAERAPVLPIRVGFEHAHLLDIRSVQDAPRRGMLRIANRGERGLFLPTGTLIVGGERDRMLMRDVVVAPKAATLVDTLPAAYARTQHAKPKPYRVMPAMAPTYLRELVLFDPSTYQVRKLLRQFGALLPPDESATLSLADLMTSERLRAYCVACEADVRAFRELITPETIGFATFIRGRLQAFELYGSNALLQAHFEPTLRAHAFKAAALTQHAETMGIPLHDDGARVDALKRAHGVAADVIRDLDAATLRKREVMAQGTEGEMWTLSTHAARGTLLEREDRLVHLALFVHDPYEEALYSRELDAPDMDDTRDAPFVGRKAEDVRERRRDLLPDDAAEDLERARKGDAIRKRLRPVRPTWPIR